MVHLPEYFKSGQLRFVLRRRRQTVLLQGQSRWHSSVRNNRMYLRVLRVYDSRHLLLLLPQDERKRPADVSATFYVKELLWSRSSSQRPQSAKRYWSIRQRNGNGSPRQSSNKWTESNLSAMRSAGIPAHASWPSATVPATTGIPERLLSSG